MAVHARRLAARHPHRGAARRPGHRGQAARAGAGLLTVRWTYLLVLAGCLAGALWLEPLLKVGVLRQVRRLVLSVAPVAAGFVALDLLAIHAGHLTFDPGEITSLVLPGGLALEGLP